MSKTVALWNECKAFWKSETQTPPACVPSDTLATLRSIYDSGDLWQGEGEGGTVAQRMAAFRTTERVESLLAACLRA